MPGRLGPAQSPAEPGTDRILWSSSRDIEDGEGSALLGGLDSRADWWTARYTA